METQRCFGDGHPLYEAYHDTEWGVAVHGEIALLERLSLEGFQSGLSWLTVLIKREAFREVFSGFDPYIVAEYTEDDIERLLKDSRIIRHRAKITATIANAHATRTMLDAGESLDELVWSFAPPPRERPASYAELKSSTPESQALARELKRRGFRFIGPTTAYSAMQACGLVNDHLASCPVTLPPALPPQ